MRIISGLYRGKKLFSPRSANIRPTLDQSREAVFNILYSKLNREWKNLRLADIFTGSGAFALEAISRGVACVTLVDLDLTDAKRNITLFPNEQKKINLLKADATCLPYSQQSYDIIFLDAPYNKGLSEQALISLLKQNWLVPDSICIVELAKKEPFICPAEFTIIDERAYGITRFIFLR